MFEKKFYVKILFQKIPDFSRFPRSRLIPTKFPRSILPIPTNSDYPIPTTIVGPDPIPVFQVPAIPGPDFS